MRWSQSARAALRLTRPASLTHRRSFVTRLDATCRLDSRLLFTKRTQPHQTWFKTVRNYASSNNDETAATAEQDSVGAVSQSTTKPLTDRGDDESTAAERKAKVEAIKQEQPSYQLTFTCAKCLDRSSHRISKQGYHHGTVLVTCPGCKNKHLISDHLGIFSDKNITLEDIMKEKGELLKKGVLGADGDVEFYTEPDANSINKIVVDKRRPPG